MIKKLLVSIFFAVSFFTAYSQENTDALWNKANQFYAEGDYEMAVTLYDSLVNHGFSSHQLYYNLGNAYFKSGQTGKSILYFNKALLLAPSDKDTEYNLAIANGYIRDRIDIVPEFFLKNWMRSIQYCMSSNMWAVVSLFMLAVMLVAVLLFLLSGKLSVKKGAFYCGILSLIIFIFSVIVAARIKNSIEDPAYAIVLSSSAPVKSSPDNNNRDLFILHEGTKVKVGESIGEWREITVSDGNKGWINRSTIEFID